MDTMLNKMMSQREKELNQILPENLENPKSSENLECPKWDRLFSETSWSLL